MGVKELNIVNCFHIDHLIMETLWFSFSTTQFIFCSNMDTSKVNGSFKLTCRENKIPSRENCRSCKSIHWLQCAHPYADETVVLHVFRWFKFVKRHVVSLRLQHVTYFIFVLKRLTWHMLLFFLRIDVPWTVCSIIYCGGWCLSVCRRQTNSLNDCKIYCFSRWICQCVCSWMIAILLSKKRVECSCGGRNVNILSKCRTRSVDNWLDLSMTWTIIFLKFTNSKVTSCNSFNSNSKTLSVVSFARICFWQSSSKSNKPFWHIKKESFVITQTRTWILPRLPSPSDYTFRTMSDRGLWRRCTHNRRNSSPLWNETI